jgi:hypothetical protein
MQFNAKDDFVNEYQSEVETELDAEHKLEDEQDNGYDKKGLTEEQLHNFREQNIKAMYAKLYQMGLKTEQVRARLDKMSMFFGNIGAVSNMSDDEIAAVNRMLDELKVRNYKF